MSKKELKVQVKQAEQASKAEAKEKKKLESKDLDHAPAPAVVRSAVTPVRTSLFGKLFGSKLHTPR